MRVALMLLVALLNLPVGAGELTELLQASLRHPTIAAAGQNTLAADETLAAAHADYWGSGGLQAERSHYEDQRFVGVLSPQALTNPPFAQGISRYGLFYQLPIDLAGVIKTNRLAAEQDLAAAQLAERQQRLINLHATTEAYVGLQALEQQRQTLVLERQRVEKTVERVAQQLQSQQVSRAELSLAQAELARLRADEVRLAGMLEQTQAALRAATGLERLPGSKFIAIPQWSTHKSSDYLPVAMAQIRADSAKARAESARRALWPHVSVNVDYSQFDAGQHDPDAWRITANVTLPIDPAGRRRAASARAMAASADHQQKALLREAQRNWTALESAWQSARADARASEQEVAARREVVRVQAELQRVGMSSLEELLRQQRDLLGAVDRLSSAQASAVVAWSAAAVLAGMDPLAYISAMEAAASD